MKAASLVIRFFSFPLLAKELTEVAARRRTYEIRVIYGVLMFAVIALWMPRSIWSGSDESTNMAMGAGSEIFGKVLVLEFAGLALFLPALMCGSITHEKERDSLVLLLLTDLRPWSIILQKYVSGLVPVLSFLLLAMPLAAIAYAFGGISADDLFWSSISLLLTACQMGALSLMLSGWCRTTVGAFIGTYLGTVALYAGPPILMQMVSLGGMSPGRRFMGGERIDWLLFPPNLLEDAINGTQRDLDFLLQKIAAILISIVIFLVLARFFLVRRAFLSASSVFLKLFRVLDKIMHWLNRFAGNITLVRDVRSLPEDEPVVWREITRKALGKAHYLFRICMALEIPVALICGAAVVESSGYSRQSAGLSIVAAFVGALGVLALGAQAANMIVSERIQQTLELLLTTPLGAAEIVKQKAKALRRVMFILAIPLITIFGTECWVEHDFAREWRTGLLARDGALLYALCAALSLLIFLPLASWLALWIGLKMRTRFKAIVTALAIIVGWCALPLVTENFFDRPQPNVVAADWIKAIGLFSPISIVATNEAGELGRFLYSPAVEILVTFSFHGFLLWLIRRQALRHADFYMRR